MDNKDWGLPGWDAFQARAAQPAPGLGGRKDAPPAPGTGDASLLPKKTRRALRPTVCQVDGCSRDLSAEKAYLQRYSVCEGHFKAEVAIVHGQEMRFCQQCNKFQDLREFEGSRRSCAARSKDRNMRRRLQTTLQKGPGGGDGSEVLLQSTSNQRDGQFMPQTSGSPGRSPPQGGGAASETSGGGAGSAEGSAGGSAALLAARRQGGSGGSEYSLDAHAMGLGVGVGGMGGPMSAGHAGMHSAGVPARAMHPQQQQQQQYTFGDGPQQHQAFNGGHGSGAGGGVGGSSSNMDADFTADHRQSAGAGMGTWARSEQVGQSPYETEAALGQGIGRRHGPQSADAYGRRSYMPGELASGMAPGMGSTAGFMEGGGGGMMDLDTFVSGGEQSQAQVQLQQQQQHHQQQQQQHAQGGSMAAGSRQHSSFGAPQQGMAGFNQHGRNDSPAGGLGLSGAWGPSPDQVRILESPYDGGRGSAQYAMGGQQQQQQLLQQQGSMPMPASYNVQHQAGLSQQGVGAPSDGGAAELLEQLHTSQSHRPHLVGAMEGPQYRGSGSGSGGYPGGMSVGMALDDMQMGAGGMHRGSNLGPSGMGSAPPVRGPSTTGLMGGPDSGSQRSRVVQYQQQQQQPQVPQHAYSQPLPGFMSRGQQQTQQQPEDMSNVMQDRRAALIRQQLLSGPQSQASGRGVPASQSQQELLAQQEQLAMLNAYGDSSFLGLTPSETAQLQLLASGGQGLDRRGGRMGAGHSLADIAEYSGQDAGPNSNSSIAMDMSGAAGGAGASRMMSMHGPASAPPNINSYGTGAGGMVGGALHGSMPLQQPHGSMAPRGQQSHPHMMAQQHSASVMDVLQQCALGSGGAAQHPHPQAHQNQTQSVLMRSSGPGSAGVHMGGDEGPGRYGGGGGGGRIGMGMDVAGQRSMDLMHHPAVEHGGGDMGGLGEGPRLLSGLLPGAGGRDDALAARVCLKLFSCMPEDLPGDMLARLRRWAVAAESDAMQVFMRPGCVHVIVSIRHSGGQEAIERHVLGNGDLDAAVAALRRAFDSSGLLRGRRVVVQAAEGPRGAFEHDGVAGGARWVSDADMARAPSVVSIMPPAIPCGTATVAVLAGRNLLRPGTRYYARCGGRSYELRPLVQQPHTINSKTSTQASVPQAVAAAAVHTPRGQLRGHAAAGQPQVGGSHGAGGPTTPPMVSGDASVAPDSPMATAAPSTSSSDSYASSARSTAARSEANTAEHPLSTSTSMDHGGSGAAPTPTSVPAAAAVKGGSPLRRSSRGDAAKSYAPALVAGERVVAVASAAAQAGRAAAASEATAAAATTASDQLECVLVHVPALPKHGLMAVEAVHAEVDVMGAWAPGVACQDPGTAVEINAWVRRSSDPCSSRWLLLELGVLLDYDSVLPSLLETTPGANSTPGAAAAAVAGADVEEADAVVDARAGDVAAESVVRALTPAAHALQPRRNAAVLPVASNPLPLGRGPDHLEMSAAASAAVAGAGALSAVPYQQQHQIEAAAAQHVHESLLSPREDGTLELRLLPSSPAAPEQSPQEQQQQLQQQAARDIGRVPYTVISVAPTEHEGNNGIRGSRNSNGTEDNASISDDTLKVPDAAARPAGTSYGRLLAHPLLHPNCRRTMLANASRLLVYSVASGLPLLASGLLEWLMGIEAPVMGLSAAAVAAATSQVAQQLGAGAATCHTAGGHMAALSALFGRVLARAAAATERAMAAASLSVPGNISTSGGTDGGEGENLYPAALDSAAIVPGLAQPQSPGLLASGYEPLPLTPPISGQSFSSNSFTLESRLESFTDGAQRSVGGGGGGFSLGLGLLHLAVASGDSGMVLAALDWADMYGRPWSLDELSGPRRTSPLHLAAALSDGGEIARLLLSLPSTGPHGGQWADAWLLLRDGLGRTPADIAAANPDPGLAAVNHFCVYGEDEDAGEAEAHTTGEIGGEGAGVGASTWRRGDATSRRKNATLEPFPEDVVAASSAEATALLAAGMPQQQKQQKQLGHVGSPLLLVGGLVLALALALMMLSSSMWLHA